MGSAESLYECPQILDETAPYEFMICLPEAFWLKSNWTTALWVMWSAFFGMLSGGIYYGWYLLLLEWMRSWPVNMVEYLGSEVAVADLRWPPFLGIKHGTSSF